MRGGRHFLMWVKLKNDRGAILRAGSLALVQRVRVEDETAATLDVMLLTSDGLVAHG